MLHTQHAQIFERYSLIVPRRKRAWDAETSLGQVVFIRKFQQPDERLILGDYYKLYSLDQDIVFYLQLQEQEPICIDIPNVHWKSLLEFIHAPRMRSESRLVSDMFFDAERWHLFRRGYSTFWNHLHSYFQLEFSSGLTTQCLLNISYTDIEPLKTSLERIGRKRKTILNKLASK
jgi:hypothetical protein